MKDPNRPPSDPEAAQQILQSQQPPDAEAQPSEALPPTDSSPAPADLTENLVAENPLAPSDVSSLPESPSLADNANQSEVLGQDIPDAFDGLPAPIESDDDMIGMLDLRPWLSDSIDAATDAATDATTDAEPSSFPADFSSGETPSFSDRGPSVDPFAASPPPFTGPLVEVSPGVCVYPGFSMPWSTDTAAQASEPAGSHAGLPWLHLTLGSSQAERFIDKALDRTAMRLNRIVDEKIESALNYEAHVRNSQMRALNGR
jgi:hypothetical protein